jgi:hypothetical protein
VALIRKLNPGVPIHGLFGGSNKALRIVAKQLAGLDELYVSRAPGRWSWQHSDLVLSEWYRDAGSAVSFDVVHAIEWDLLLLEPLESLYASVPSGAVGLTALTPIAGLEKEWTWLWRPENRRAWETLLAHARAEWGYDDVPYGCVAGGSCFPRAFLEEYAKIDAPPLCHDELRLPLFAQILGFPIADTRLRGPWRGERDHPFFHFRGQDIELTAIRGQLERPDGWRAFHPVRSRIDPDRIFA